MINVQPYLDKLDRLKEYMDNSIDGIGKLILVDIDEIPKINPDEFLRFYAETGLIFCNGNPPPNPTRKITFEEYLQLNN